MRILVANKMDWTHPNSGGAETNLRQTLTQLAEKGHDVHLLCARYPDSEKKEEIENVQIHRYGFKSHTNELYILTIGQIHFNHLLNSLDPDIIYTINSMMPWLPIFGSDKHLIGIHHLGGKTILKELPSPFNICGYIAEKISTFLARRKPVITVSDATKNDLVAKGISEENITKINNGIKTEKYISEENTEEPTVLYLGRLEYSKGVDLLPRIHEKISQNFQNYSLEIAGSGRKEAEIRKFADQTENVSFHGYVSEEGKIELLSKSWVAITPSRREGWGLVVNEANASKTPVVGFDTGGLKESIQDEETGILIPNNPNLENHIEEFGEEVSRLLKQDEKREELAENAKSRVRSFSWEETAKDLEKLFYKVKNR